MSKKSDHSVREPSEGHVEPQGSTLPTLMPTHEIEVIDAPPAKLPTLARLSAMIRHEHDGVVRALQRGVQHARKAGDLLVQAKEQVGHGDWKHWVESECDLSMRTCQAYMRIARNWNQIEEKAQSIAPLTVNQAMALIARKLPRPNMEHPDPRNQVTAESDHVVEQSSTGSEGVSHQNALPPSTTQQVSDPDLQRVIAHLQEQEDKEEVLRSWVGTSEHLLEQILANPVICEFWAVTARETLAEKLVAIKTMIDRTLNVLAVPRR